MKVFILVFFFGLASASLHDVLDDDELVFADVQSNFKTELGEKLYHILNQIKDALAREKSVGRELLDQAKDILAKLRENGAELDERTKDILRDIKDHAKEWWKELLDVLNIHKPKHSFRAGVTEFDEYVVNLIRQFHQGVDLKTIKGDIKSRLEYESNHDNKVILHKLLKAAKKGEKEFRKYTKKLVEQIKEEILIGK